jgi:PhnB protein
MENSITNQQVAVFAPELYIKNVAAAIEFYKIALNAVELRRWNNDDGTVHVAELLIIGAMFHIHEDVINKGELSPAALNNCTTVNIGLFVSAPDEMMAKAVDTGASVTSPMQDYEYGYRQGSFTDPFGHRWTFQKSIP